MKLFKPHWHIRTYVKMERGWKIRDERNRIGEKKKIAGKLKDFYTFK